MSRICEMFSCPPDVAESQHWPTVEAIIDFRIAKRVADLRDEGKDDEISDNPAFRYWDNVLSHGEEMARAIEEERKRQGLP